MHFGPMINSINELEPSPDITAGDILRRLNGGELLAVGRYDGDTSTHVYLWLLDDHVYVYRTRTTRDTDLEEAGVEEIAALVAESLREAAESESTDPTDALFCPDCAGNEEQ